MEQQVSRPLGHGEEERPYPLPDCLRQSIVLSLSGRVQARNHIRDPGRLRVRPRGLGQHIPCGTEQAGRSGGGSYVHRSPRLPTPAGGCALLPGPGRETAGQYIVVVSGLGHALKIIAVLQGSNGLKNYCPPTALCLLDQLADVSGVRRTGPAAAIAAPGVGRAQLPKGRVKEKPVHPNERSLSGPQSEGLLNETLFLHVNTLESVLKLRNAVYSAPKRCFLRQKSSKGGKPFLRFFP